MKPGSLASVGVLILAACGGGGGDRLLLDGATPQPLTTIDVTQPVIEGGSVLVPGLQSVDPEPALRGVLIRATAVTPRQGYYGARLVPTNRGEPDEDGVLTYAFRAFPPLSPQPLGAAVTRQLIAATFVHDDQLQSIRQFRIVAEGQTVDLRR